jgi:ABC-type transport system involved in multi-copper enzyme maturation permease subunit
MLTNLILLNLGILVPLAIVLFCAIIGFRDVLQFSPTRTLAIARVCYRESIRRRVLYVIPLAVLGVLVVSLFQRPIDELDAVRQTLKFCLFATGMLVVMLGIILACTNLPREIENRVIYTIVTKPTTRLEIVLGKVLGFSAVSALLLGIMGVFTFGYLGIQAARMQGAITAKLEMPAGNLQPGERQTLEHYRDFGLLTAKKLEPPTDTKVLATAPRTGDDKLWFGEFSEGDVIVPFRVNHEELLRVMEQADSGPNAERLAIRLTVSQRPAEGASAKQPVIAPFVDPNADGRTANISVSLTDAYGQMLASEKDLDTAVEVLTSRTAPTELLLPIPSKVLPALGSQRAVGVRIVGASRGRLYGLGKEAASIVVVGPDDKNLLDAAGKPRGFVGDRDYIEADRQRVSFRGRQSGRGGQQLTGSAARTGPVALLQYRNAPLPADTGPVGLEVHMAVERSGDNATQDIPTIVEASFFNLANPSAAPVVLTAAPENNRLLFLTVPAAAVAGGNFDIQLRCLTDETWVTVSTGDVLLVSQRQPFAWNLFLSLSVLWLLSVLVVTTAVFTSTFLSWPIAVVLTLMLLLGRWLVEALGDSIATGIGNQFVTTMGVKGAAESQAISKSVEALAGLLRTLGAILPDIGVFAAMQDIERGMRVPLYVLLDSGLMVLIFGLPLLALSYLFLKYKEVAP